MTAKEINIKIRFDDENGKIGFAIDRDKKIFDDVTETLKLIAALEMLKNRELARITKTQTFNTTYDKKDDDIKFWNGAK